MTQRLREGGVDFTGPRERWSTARQALLYALPLVLLALLGAQWLDADFVMLRESAQKQTELAARYVGDAGARAVSGLSEVAWADVGIADADAVDPPSRLWQVIHGYDLGLLVLRREGDRTLFPPEDPLAMPRVWEDKLRALIDVADLQREGDTIQGWFPHISDEYYFECKRSGAEGPARSEACVALSGARVFPTMLAALDASAADLPNWSFRLRDPFDRVVWRHGDATATTQSFPLARALHGWALDVSGAPTPQRDLAGRLALAAPLALIWLALVVQSRRADHALRKETAARAALAARLSHDLRTPLANLKLYAELISRKSAGTPGVDRYCAVLTEEIDRLDLLAGETIFRADAGRDAAQVKGVADPCALAQKIAARYERLLAASGSSCEIACDAEKKILRFDTIAFERIFINLLDNARKYAPGRICVGVEWRDGLLGLSVRDFGGAGARLVAGPHELGSHGMGLAIVRELTSANGGGFSLSGADPGLCARATIRAAEEGGENPDC
jgi:signal transduction histidine kinase